MNILDDVIARLRGALIGLDGDEPLMAAAVSAAALVIAADAVIAEEEIETALADLTDEPTLRANYRPSELALELRMAIERTATPAGRAVNLAKVSALAHRAIEDRNNVFLIAIDAAMAHQGVGEIEDRTLSDLASRLAVDKAALVAAVEARQFVTGGKLGLGGTI